MTDVKRHIATLKPDTWHDIKLHLVPSKSNDIGYINIYLDEQSIFEAKGKNLRKDATSDLSLFKVGMYTNIRDERSYFMDSIEMASYLPGSISNWVAGKDSDSKSPYLNATETSADGSKIILNYSEALSKNTAPASAFTLTVDGDQKTISKVTTEGQTIELLLESPVAAGEQITLSYTDPSSGNDIFSIQDSAGNDAQSISNQTVINNRPSSSSTTTTTLFATPVSYTHLTLPTKA